MRWVKVSQIICLSLFGLIKWKKKEEKRNWLKNDVIYLLRGNKCKVRANLE